MINEDRISGDEKEVVMKHLSCDVDVCIELLIAQEDRHLIWSLINTFSSSVCRLLTDVNAGKWSGRENQELDNYLWSSRAQ